MREVKLRSRHPLQRVSEKELLDYFLLNYPKEVRLQAKKQDMI